MTSFRDSSKNLIAMNNGSFSGYVPPLLCADSNQPFPSLFLPIFNPYEPGWTPISTTNKHTFTMQTVPWVSAITQQTSITIITAIFWGFSFPIINYLFGGWCLPEELQTVAVGTCNESQSDFRLNKN